MSSPAPVGKEDEWHTARKRPSAAAKHVQTHRNGATICGTALVASLLPNSRAALTVMSTCMPNGKKPTKLVARLLSEYGTLRLWDCVKFYAADKTVVFLEKLHSSVVYRGVGRVAQLDAIHGRFGYVEVAHVGPVKGPMKRSTTELFFHGESLVPHFSDVNDALRKGEAVVFDAVDNDTGVAHATRSKYRAVRLVSLSDCVRHADTADASVLNEDERAWLRTVAGLRQLAEDTPPASDADTADTGAAADSLSSAVAGVRLDEADDTDVCMEDVRSLTGTATPVGAAAVEEGRSPPTTGPPAFMRPAAVVQPAPSSHGDVMEMAASGGRVSVTDFTSGCGARVSGENVYDAMRLMTRLVVEDIQRFHGAPEPYARSTEAISDVSHAALGMTDADCAPCRQRKPTLFTM